MRSLRSFVSPAVLAILLPAAALPALAGTWSGTVETRDGVPHVRNPAAPVEPPVTVELEELWRIGGHSEEEGELFGVIRNAVLDEQGNVYLLDAQLAEIKVFSPEGEYLRTIGREGEGPGEFRQPRDLLFSPDGKVAVIPMHGDIVLLTPEGDPGGSINPGAREDGARRMLMNGAGTGDRIVILGTDMKMEPGKMTATTSLAAFDLEGRETARFYEADRVNDFAKFVFDETKSGFIPWAGAPGRVYGVTSWGEYAIQVWSDAGEPLRVIHRDFEHRMRTPQEMEEAKSQFVIRGPVDPEIRVSEHEPDIRALFPRPDGSLWVETSRSTGNAEPGVLGTLDVFDPEGRFVRTITLKGEGDLEADRVVIQGDRLLVLRHFESASRSMWSDGGGGDADAEEEAEPMVVIVYRIGSDPSDL